MSERGPRGARLVALDEHGDRQLDLVAPAAAIARDTHPALSPDGAWLVFASSRERSLDETSLWIAPVKPDAIATRLTTGAPIDAYPAWTADGRAIVFASTRAGTFDLYRLPIDHGRAGEPERLTTAPGHEVAPAPCRDGTILYAAVDADGKASHLEARAPDGAITRLTDGPADTSPAISPDGVVIAFARPVEHPGGSDGELWIMRKGEAPHVLVDLPLTDEAGPVWSPDGRYLFATSVLRGANGNAVFSSVIVIDTHARHPIARMLEDRVGAIARLTPAVASARLDAQALAADPEYLPELARIVAQHTP